MKDKDRTINTDNMLPYQLVQRVLNGLPDVSIIKLRASIETIKNRIQQRGRACEIEHYTDEYLKTMVESYV